MKKIKSLIFVLIVILIALLPILLSFDGAEASSCTPPSFPSSFYGTVTGLKEGDIIGVWIGSKMVTATEVRVYNGQKVYSVNVSANDTCNGVMGGAGGNKVVFKYRSKAIGSGVWHGGTNQNVNLKCKR